jgi:hypothetical protein
LKKRDSQNEIVRIGGGVRWSPIACGFITLAWAILLGIYKSENLKSVEGFPRAFLFVIDSMNLSHIVDYTGTLFLSAVFIVCAISIGKGILNLFKGAPHSLLENILFSLGLGLGTLSLLGFALGTTGFYSSVVMRFAFALLTLVSIFLNARFKSVFHEDVRAIKSQSSSRFILALSSTMLACIIILNLVAALGPEVFYDSLVYHLGLPKLYLLNGRIIPTLNNIYSGVPFNAEMLYGFGLAIGGEGVAKLIPFSLGLAILVLMFSWIRRYSSRDAALVAMLLFYSSPMIAAQSWHTLVELSWCYHSLLAMYCVITADADKIASYRRLALAGIFTGLALGTKYNAITSAAALFVVLVLKFKSLPNLSRSEALKRLGFFLFATGIVASPWIAKNYFYYQNPIFPMFDGWFFPDSRGVDWRGLAADAKGRSLQSLFTPWGLWDSVAALWSNEWRGLDSLGMGFIVLLPWVFFLRWRTLPVQMTYLALIMGWAGWTLSSRMPRFMIFIIPLLAIILAMGIFSVDITKKLRRMVLCLMFAGCAFNIVEIFRNWVTLGNWQVVIGRMDKSTYLEHTRPMYPTPYYAAMKFINDKSPLRSRVLLLGSRGDTIAREISSPTRLSRRAQSGEWRTNQNPQPNYLVTCSV